MNKLGFVRPSIHVTPFFVHTVLPVSYGAVRKTLHVHDAKVRSCRDPNVMVPMLTMTKLAIVAGCACASAIIWPCYLVHDLHALEIAASCRNPTDYSMSTSPDNFIDYLVM